MVAKSCTTFNVWNPINNGMFTTFELVHDFATIHSITLWIYLFPVRIITPWRIVQPDLCLASPGQEWAIPSHQNHGKKIGRKSSSMQAMQSLYAHWLFSYLWSLLCVSFYGQNWLIHADPRGDGRWSTSWGRKHDRRQPEGSPGSQQRWQVVAWRYENWDSAGILLDVHPCKFPKKNMG